MLKMAGKVCSQVKDFAINNIHLFFLVFRSLLAEQDICLVICGYAVKKLPV